MAKELPYFRFTAQEWQNGDISLESYELKGLFIDICAYYWIKDCSITLAMLQKRYSNVQDLLKVLIDLQIIKVENNDEYVTINFLNEQFDILSEARKRRQEAGSKGGKKKRSNAKAMQKQSSSYKDKDNYKDNYKDNNIPFESFWNLYNKKVGDKKKVENKFNKLSTEIKEQIMKTLPEFLATISDKQFLPYPETYLNKKRWEDDLTALKQSKPPVQKPPEKPDKFEQPSDEEYDKTDLREIIKN